MEQHVEVQLPREMQAPGRIAYSIPIRTRVLRRQIQLELWRNKRIKGALRSVSGRIDYSINIVRDRPVLKVDCIAVGMVQPTPQRDAFA